MLGVFNSPLFTLVVTGVLVIRFPFIATKENFQTLDVSKLSKLERGTELVLIESGYNEQKAYRLEDFFWTGSGDGSIDDNRDSGDTARPTTIYKTKTVLSTMYVPTTTTYYNQTYSDTTTNCPYCDTTMTPDGEISPTPTFDSYEDSTTDYVPDADRQFWLLTVLKTDGNNPTVNQLKNGLANLYKTAFQRQQERHLGINARLKRAISNPDKPVTVYIIKILKSPINGDEKMEVLYHVSVSGQPVAATTAAADMHLVSDQEVVNELGYPFIIKAEPYLKVNDPEYLSSTNHTWIFIGVALSILLVLLLLVAFLTLAMNKRTPAQMPNRGDTFQQNVAIGQTNEAFIQNETELSKKLEQSPTYINFRTHSSNATLRSGLIVTRPSSTSSSSLSGASIDISPLMNLKKQSTPPKNLNAVRPKAALNKTVPAQVSIDSDSGSETSRGDSKVAIKYKNVDPCVISPKSYLSMPSVKSFPRGNNPEPLNKVLEPISVLHLDIDDEGLDPLDSDRRLDGLLTRYGSLSVVEDPGVIGPIVWSEHCKRLQRGVSMDQGMDDGKLKGNSSKMRKRFHDLLDDTFSLFGSRRDSPVEEGGRPIAFEVKSHSANMTRPPDDLQADTQRRPKTTEPRRALAVSKPPRGAWATNAPSPLSRPLSAGPLQRRPPPPRVDVDRVLTEGALSPSDPALPLIAAIKTELGKCSLPGSTTNLVG